MEEGADSLSNSHAHVETGNTGDDNDTLPPPTSVAAVRATISNSRLAAYLQEFDAEAEEESRVFCSLPATVVDDTARAQMLAAGIEKEDDDMQHRNEVGHIDVLRHNRIMELEEARLARRGEQLQNLRSIEMQRQQTSELVTAYYDHAHRELDIHLTSRMGEVSQSIGEIRKFRRGDYDPDKPDWAQFEQQVQIRVAKVRGLKNKIPKGEYIVLVSKWDKLGGTPLRWSNRDVTDRPPPPCPMHGDMRNMRVKKACEVCMGWAGATMPTHHSGDPKAYELDVDSRVFTFFQPQTRIKPYNALVFELIRLTDKNRRVGVNETDDVLRPRVVGWGVIPIVDSHFEVINGRFRFPMLRGPYKPHFGHYKTVQNAIVDDLENWLGNIYVDIFPHPREHFGRSEFQLQTDFANKLLNLSHYPSSKDPEGWPFDERKRGASIDENAGHGQLKVMGGVVSMAENFRFDDEEFPYQRPDHVVDAETPALRRWNLLRQAIMDRQRNKRIAEQNAQKEAIRRLEASKMFRYSIHPYGSTQLQSVWRTQVEYCMRAILDELSLRDPLTPKFWLVQLVFWTSLYFQLYIHGIFVYLALRAAGIPVNAVVPQWYGLDVEYSHRNTWPLEELFVVFFSQISTYFLVLFLISGGWFFRALAGNIPEQLSKFVFTSALAATMVPFIEIILDGALAKRRSDFFRLLEFMQQHDYGIYYAIIIFVIVYLTMLAGCIVSTFLYTMALHLNGILQDAYWRIMIVNEETCHIPDDLEVSMHELKHIVRTAERWRGKNGERRKISVSRLKTTDDQDDDYLREDLQIVVAQLDCGDTKRWIAREDHVIYRQFFVMNDGTILETLADGSPIGVSFVLNNIAKKLRLNAKAGGVDIISALFGGASGGIGKADDNEVSQSGAKFFDSSPNAGKSKKRVAIL